MKRSYKKSSIALGYKNELDRFSRILIVNENKLLCRMINSPTRGCMYACIDI